MDKNVYLELMYGFSKVSQAVISGALLEVGAKTVDSVRPSDRRMVVNLCQRRLPQTKNRHIVAQSAQIGDSDYLIRKHGEGSDKNYGWERGAYGIERNDTSGVVEQD